MLWLFTPRPGSKELQPNQRTRCVQALVGQMVEQRARDIAAMQASLVRQAKPAPSPRQARAKPAPSPRSRPFCRRTLPATCVARAFFCL